MGRRAKTSLLDLGLLVVKIVAELEELEVVVPAQVMSWLLTVILKQGIPLVGLHL